MHFGATIAVQDVSFAVARGTVFGIIGSDGAGKSTLLRLVATMIPPAAGMIRIDNLDVVAQCRAVKRLIGYMPQRFGLYQDLTVEENIDFFLDIFGVRGADRQRRKERYLGFSKLLPFRQRQVGKLSGGMKQKLGLACALVHEPQLLILDEPTNGVDPVSRREFWEILMQMRRAGITIIVSTAYLDEGEWCDRVAIMHGGRFLALDTPTAVRGSYPCLEEALIARIRSADAELAHAAFSL